MISTKTNVTISPEQELTLKSRLGEAISILSGKSERWLMLSFEDKCQLYFQGNNSNPIAYVEVKVFGRIDYSQSNKLTAKICEIFGDVLDIAASNVYIKYEEVEMWGWNGGNF
mgnify:FL=1